ncbi:MAG TPA: hypothetical protein PK609_01010 [Candidatus Paceibacterota bacterium]|nr:hypothetical protein [Candidatus Paceibacterota bacterium]
MFKVTNKYIFVIRQAIGWGLALFLPVWFVFEHTYLTFMEKCVFLLLIAACEIGLLIIRNDWESFAIIKEVTKEH